MTQVPGPSQRPVDAPVVPGDASTPDSRAEASATVATARQDVDPYELLTRALKLAGDAASLTQHGPRYWTRITGQLLADPELLDALVAYRQQHRVIETRAQLAESPTGTVIRTSQGDTWLIDHGPQGEWVGGRTRIYCQEPNTELVYYPANFDLSLPVTVLWSPPDTTERPTE